jgi:hypothetical protein
MTITKNNPRLRVVLLLLAAVLTAWAGVAAIPAAADTSDWIWTTTDKLIKWRFAPTATLVDLRNVGTGVLLVGGGNETVNPLNPYGKDLHLFKECEFYALRQQKFIHDPPPSLKQPRALHTATLLPNRKILVVGGISRYVLFPDVPALKDFVLPTFENTCELFDPNHPDGNWTAAKPVPVGRAAHTATLLHDGQRPLLVAGGLNAELTVDDWLIYPIVPLKAHLDVRTSDSSALYDWTTGDWDNATALKHGRVLHTATLLTTGRNSGKVLVIGGVKYLLTVDLDLTTKSIKSRYEKLQTLKSCELYNPATGQWDNATSLNVPRAFHTATLLPGGKVLVAGGQSGFDNNTIVHRSYEIYDPESDNWTCKDDPEGLPIPSSQHTATQLGDNTTLLVGGSVEPNAAQIYDPIEDSWSLASDFLNFPRAGHTATLLNDKDGMVFVAGGAPNWGELFRPASTSALMQRRVSWRDKARPPGD